jgi:hypothetical protein
MAQLLNAELATAKPAGDREPPEPEPEPERVLT